MENKKTSELFCPDCDGRGYLEEVCTSEKEVELHTKACDLCSGSGRLLQNPAGASMSYDIYLNDPVTKECIVLTEPHHIRGGTYCVGGETRLHLNVTYNYAPHFYRLFGEKGIRSLYGKSGAETIQNLKDAISFLKDEVSDNYWDPTEGNAKRALYGLLSFAQMRPDGVWDGD